MLGLAYSLECAFVIPAKCSTLVFSSVSNHDLGKKDIAPKEYKRNYQFTHHFVCLLFSEQITHELVR